MLQSEGRAALESGLARLPGTRAQKRNGSAKKKKNDEEQQLQIGCHSWNQLNEKKYPLLKWMFHCPNGGGRSKAEGGILKAMGVKPGVPDFMLPFETIQYKGLAIELKATDGKLTDQQREWLQQAHSSNWCVAVVRNLDEYLEVIRAFLLDRLAKEIGHDEIFRGAR